MIPSYVAGSGKSDLMKYLESSHYNVNLFVSEKLIIACWIDLFAPFCGSYAEANLWSKYFRDKYNYYTGKRKLFTELEMKGLQKK